jgi:hypothetical protein
MARTHAAEERVMYVVTSRNNRRCVANGVLCGSAPRSLLSSDAVNTSLQQRINTQQYRKWCFLWFRPEAKWRGSQVDRIRHPCGDCSNTCTVALWVVGGDEKGTQCLGYNRATLFLGDINAGTWPPGWGSLECETVTYGHESRGTLTWE